ncbi:hypothetical protein GF362_04340 [Candidatus Dojkabacteria bacterium]|nr:hypothetical protein [Candidatus Dojkabacteria bacterium]
MKPFINFLSILLFSLVLILSAGGLIVVATASLLAQSDNNYISANSQDESLLLSDDDEENLEVIHNTFEVYDVKINEYKEAGMMKIYNASDSLREIYIHFRPKSPEDKKTASNFIFRVYRGEATYLDENNYRVTRNNNFSKPIYEGTLDKIGNDLFDVIEKEGEVEYIFEVTLKDSFKENKKNDVSFSLEIEGVTIEDKDKEKKEPILDISSSNWSDLNSYHNVSEERLPVVQTFKPHIEGQLSYIEICTVRNVSIEIYEGEALEEEIQNLKIKYISKSIETEDTGEICSDYENFTKKKIYFDQSTILDTEEDQEGNFTKIYTLRFVPENDIYSIAFPPKSEYTEGRLSLSDSWENELDVAFNTWMIEK